MKKNERAITFFITVFMAFFVISVLSMTVTAKEVKATADGLKIKACMKVGDAEKLFDTNFGVTVQIKDADNKKLVPNEITLGQAARGEY